MMFLINNSEKETLGCTSVLLHTSSCFRYVFTFASNCSGKLFSNYLLLFFIFQLTVFA